MSKETQTTELSTDKALHIADVVGRSGQLVCGCEEPNVNHEDKPLPTCKDCFKPMV
jgi:hypothetical protein